MSSPYSALVADTLIKLNKAFVEELNLSPSFKYEDVLPGERFGIISFRSFSGDTDRSPADRNIHTGFGFYFFTVEILLVAGCSNNKNASGRIGAEITGVRAMLDIQHAIPTLKNVLPSDLIYDLVTNNDTAMSLRQMIRPPNDWVVDVTATAVAKLVIYKNAQGEHVPYPLQ